jgi:predicted aspartyl protease
VQLALTSNVGGRDLYYPAAVIGNLIVRAPNGQAHARLWEGMIDTGADLTVLPLELGNELPLTNIRQRVRAWSYRKDEAPREFDVYYVRIEFLIGVLVPAKVILSERKNILIGRSALTRMRLEINWPANYWSLTQES